MKIRLSTIRNALDQISDVGGDLVFDVVTDVPDNLRLTGEYQNGAASWSLVVNMQLAEEPQVCGQKRYWSAVPCEQHAGHGGLHDWEFQV